MDLNATMFYYDRRHVLPWQENKIQDINILILTTANCFENASSLSVLSRSSLRLLFRFCSPLATELVTMHFTSSISFSKLSKRFSGRRGFGLYVRPVSRKIKITFYKLTNPNNKLLKLTTKLVFGLGKNLLMDFINMSATKSIRNFQEEEIAMSHFYKGAVTRESFLNVSPHVKQK